MALKSELPSDKKTWNLKNFLEMEAKDKIHIRPIMFKTLFKQLYKPSGPSIKNEQSWEFNHINAVLLISLTEDLVPFKDVKMRKQKSKVVKSNPKIENV